MHIFEIVLLTQHAALEWQSDKIYSFSFPVFCPPSWLLVPLLYTVSLKLPWSCYVNVRQHAHSMFVLIKYGQRSLLNHDDSSFTNTQECYLCSLSSCFFHSLYFWEEHFFLLIFYFPIQAMFNWNWPNTALSASCRKELHLNHICHKYKQLNLKKI